jgi:hypothetical protein
MPLSSSLYSLLFAFFVLSFIDAHVVRQYKVHYNQRQIRVVQKYNF